MAEFCGLDLGPTYGRHPHEFIEFPPKKSPEQCVEEFRALMDTRPDIESREDDAFIRRFLIARKFDVAVSFQLFVNYHMYRRRHPELLDRFNALNVLTQQALRDGFPFVLPDRDRKGRRILILMASRWNHGQYTLQDIYRAILVTLEHLIEDPHNQMCGFVVIGDWTEFSFKNSLIFSPKVLKTMVEGLQDCFPARIKGVHFIGQPWYVEAALTVIKPFLKEKSRSKIQLHGNNLSNLHKCVPTDVLPPDFGGEGPALDAESWTQKLVDSALAEFEITPTILRTSNEEIKRDDTEFHSIC